MPDFIFDNFIGITLWHGCCPVNLLQVQAQKNEKKSWVCTKEKKNW